MILSAAASVNTIGAFLSLGAALLATAASNDRLGCTINCCLAYYNGFQHSLLDPSSHSIVLNETFTGPSRSCWYESANATLCMQIAELATKHVLSRIPECYMLWR